MIFHLSFFLFIDIFSKKQSFVSICIKFVFSRKKLKKKMELFSKLIFINLLQELRIWDVLIKDQIIFLNAGDRHFFLFQVTFSLYDVLIFLGENWSWSLRSLSFPNSQEPIRRVVSLSLVSRKSMRNCDMWTCESSSLRGLQYERKERHCICMQDVWHLD